MIDKNPELKKYRGYDYLISIQGQVSIKNGVQTLRAPFYEVKGNWRFHGSFS